MNEAQVFYATGGLMVTLFVAGLGFFKYYIDAKIDGTSTKMDGLSARIDAKIDGLSAKTDARFDTVNARFDGVNARLDGIDKKLDGISRQLETLVTYMVDHSVRIGILEEKTKNL